MMLCVCATIIVFVVHDDYKFKIVHNIFTVVTSEGKVNLNITNIYSHLTYLPFSNSVSDSHTMCSR